MFTWLGSEYLIIGLKFDYHKEWNWRFASDGDSTNLRQNKYMRKIHERRVVLREAILYVLMRKKTRLRVI